MNQKHATCLNLSLLLATLTCPAGAISASETSAFTITIHVYNYAAVPEKTLARAKDEGGRIFRGCGSDSSMGRPPSHVLLIYDIRTIQLIPGTALTLFYGCSRCHEKGQTRMRWARHCPCRIANVFMNRVTELAVVGELSAGQVLGHAIAHEIGHHLLGDDSHSPRGIMVAPWSNQHVMAHK